MNKGKLKGKKGKRLDTQFSGERFKQKQKEKKKNVNWVNEKCAKENTAKRTTEMKEKSCDPKKDSSFFYEKEESTFKFSQFAFHFFYNSFSNNFFSVDSFKAAVPHCFLFVAFQMIVDTS